MPIDEAMSMFKNFAKEAFQRRKGTGVPILCRIIQLKYQSQYESQGLEKVLKETFGNDLLFGGPRSLQSPARCKVAVTTTDTNREARLLGNYHRAPRTKTPYQFQRFERPQQELSVWEAARATSAAPGYFKSYFKPSNGHTYQDGALKLNNPILAADYERQIIWPCCARLLPDVLLSLGTGMFPEAKNRTGEPGPRYGVGIVDGVKALVQISRDAIESDLDCEKAWDDYVQCTVSESSDKRHRFHRLTLPIYGPKIELDAVDKMEELQRLTEKYYETQPDADAGSPSRQLDDVAAQLIASLFYFDLSSKVHLTITGMLARKRGPLSLLYNEC
jgi:Patatin-like phospholipase